MNKTTTRKPKYFSLRYSFQIGMTEIQAQHTITHWKLSVKYERILAIAM